MLKYTKKDLTLARKIAKKGQLFFISLTENDYYILPMNVRWIIINGEIYDRELDIFIKSFDIHNIMDNMSIS